jgi:hypothetical protein
MSGSCHSALWLLLITSLCQTTLLQAQDTIISKKDTDYVFSLTRPQWEADSKKFFAPGWISRVTQI